ncbi:MAG: hypothetical protein ACAH80_10415 [Alphaproteobacteria bacterium]
MSVSKIFNYLSGEPDWHFTIDEIFGKRERSVMMQTTRAGRFVERAITLTGCFMAVSASIATANPAPLLWCIGAKAGGVAGMMVTNSLMDR